MSLDEHDKRQTTFYWGMTAILLLAFFLRIYRLDYQSMWWDEIHTGALALLPLRRVFDNLLTIRNHVPLYFLLVRVWAWVMGHTDFTLRLFSAVWGVLGIPLIYRVGALVGGLRVGVLSALLLAVSPFHIWYSQEARMYTLVCASTLAAEWLLLRWLRTRSTRDLVGYGTFMLVALYTHYLALFVLVAHYAFFSLHHRRLRHLFGPWLLCAGIVGSLFGVWIALMMLSGGFAVSPIGWIAPARWYEPVLTLLTFASGPTTDLRQPWGYVALGTSLLAIGACAVVAHRRVPTESAGTMYGHEGDQAAGSLRLHFLLYWLLMPLLLVWLISLDLPIPQKRSIYMDRYLINSLPAFVMLASWGIVQLSRQRAWLAITCPSVLVVTVVPSLLNLYFDPVYARNDWRGALAYVGAEWADGDVLLMRPSDTLPMAYYMDATVPYTEFPLLLSEEEREAFLAQEIEPRMDQIAQKWRRGWLISVQENTDPHGFARAGSTALSTVVGENIVKGWLDGRYVRIAERRFAGLTLTCYGLSSVVSVAQSNDLWEGR